MSSEMQAEEPTKRAPPRAKVACQQCHARRVRCDIFQSQPCQNCRERDLVCEPIVSRRGKYTRSHTKKNGASKSARRASNLSTASDRTTIQSDLDTNIPDPSQLPGPTPPVSDHTNGTEDGYSQRQGEEGSEMLFARITETSPGQEPEKLQPNNGRTYYLNEPFSLAYMVQVVCSPPGNSNPISVHYPIPESVPDRAGDGIYMDAAQKDFLKSRGAFVMPVKRVVDALLRVYFEYFHPAYPVFDRQTFAELYQAGRLSPLVLQTIFYVGATLCDENLIQEAGFKDRAEATVTFYLRAKALYDSDYERDKVTVAAVLFILGFIWQSPEDQKDSWHWLGQAISTAQTLGMHRSTARSGLRPHHRSLWKRIWWSIYIRDRHTAAALGRPVRIRDEDCDVEPLDWSDFSDGQTTPLELLGSEQACHIHYAIEMSKLAVIMGHVLITEFAPTRDVSVEEQKTIAQQLVTWKAQLPPELNLDLTEGGGPAFFWSRMLHVSYCTCQILQCRPRQIMAPSGAEAERETLAFAAANNLTRMAEDLLTAGVLRFGQLHLVPGLFAALSVHSVEICRKDVLRRKLAENRSRQCMLALNELSKSWPVAGWILRLFISLMKRLTGGDFGFGEAAKAASASKNAIFQQHTDLSNPSPATPGAPSNDPGLGFQTTPGGSYISGDQANMPFQLYHQMNTPDAWGLEQDLFSYDHLFHDIFTPSTPYSYNGNYPTANANATADFG